MRGCLNEDELLAIAEEGVLAVTLAGVDEHVASCDDCAAIVAQIARERAPDAEDEEPPPSRDEGALAPGARVGRYVILALAGAGGMGRVYAAWDPELDRKVALKLLPPARGRDLAMQERLRLEAQAMAKLAHPNVVAVHDVGTWAGGMFLAMEFVEGHTLREWLRLAQRSVRDVLGVFVQAGRGLAAAHRAGLVHRDFKPSNVLVHHDDRAAVTDFGLARAVRAAAASAETSNGASARTSATGVAGTPAYMAPEQLEGKELDARADVFSFSVALYEALFGQHPFSSDSAPSLLRAVRAGKVRPPPARSAVPAHVRRAVMAGLAADPAARPATVAELLARLDPKPRRARAGLAAAVVIAAALALAIGIARRPEAHLCEGAEAQMAGIWDDARREAMRAAFERSGVPGADRLWEATARGFDAYAARWQAGWVDACQATRVRGSQSEALMDARMLCLRDRARTWRAIGDGLATGDRAAVERAPMAVANLPSPDACSDPRRIDRDPAPSDPAIVARRDALRERLARANAALELGRTGDARAQVGGGIDEAQALQSPELEAQARMLDGDAIVQTDPVGALAAYHAAARLAERAGREELVARLRIRLTHVLGFALMRTDEALEWGEYAQVAVDHLGDRELDVEVARVRGNALERAHRPELALPLHQKALAYAEEQASGADVRVARALNSVAMDLADMYRVDEGLDYFQRAAATYEALYGPDGPKTLMIKANVGAQLRNAGRSAEARALLEDIIARKERIFGKDSLELAGPLDSLGRVLVDLGLVDASIASFERTGAIVERQLGPENGQLLATYADLSLAQAATGRLEEARRSAERSLAIAEKNYGSKDSRVAFPLAAIAHAQEASGRCDEALATIDRALPLVANIKEEKAYYTLDRVRCLVALGRAGEALTAVEPLLADARARLPKGNLFLNDYLDATARARLAAGDAEGGLALGEEELASVTALGVVGPRAVAARFATAQALWDARPGERARAASLARSALADAPPEGAVHDAIARWVLLR